MSWGIHDLMFIFSAYVCLTWMSCSALLLYSPRVGLANSDSITLAFTSHTGLHFSWQLMCSMSANVLSLLYACVLHGHQPVVPKTESTLQSVLCIMGAIVYYSLTLMKELWPRVSSFFVISCSYILWLFVLNYSLSNKYWRTRIFSQIFFSVVKNFDFLSLPLDAANNQYWFLPIANVLSYKPLS